MRACNCARASPFQSTHPRGVRLLCQVVGFDRVLVSIHAPAWGATWRRSARYRLLQSFNPRTRVGCDKRTRRRDRRRMRFNPRTRVGCDPWPQKGPAVTVPVFQSTHPRGVRRLGARLLYDRPPVFQSTHPRGVRPVSLAGSLLLAWQVSIHAPAWGATWTHPCHRGRQ